MLTCDKCGNQIPQAAKFCPHCGDPVTEADQAQQLVTTDHVPQAEVTFGYSSSSNYPTAIELAQKIPTYEEQGEGKDKTHGVTLDVTDLELVITLWDLVGNWKSSQLLIDGQRASKSTLVHKGLGCYRKRQAAYIPQQYCFGEGMHDFNIWGCHRLRLPMNSWAEWLTFGKFDSKGVWHFDKARIKHALDSAIHEHRLCPVLQPTNVYATLDRFPDSVNPKTDPHWEYIRDYGSDVATGVRPILKRASEYVLGEFRPNTPDEDAQSGPTYVAEIDLGSTSRPAPASKPAKPEQRMSRAGCVMWGLLIVIAIAVFRSL